MVAVVTAAAMDRGVGADMAVGLQGKALGATMRVGLAILVMVVGVLVEVRGVVAVKVKDVWGMEVARVAKKEGAEVAAALEVCRWVVRALVAAARAKEVERVKMKAEKVTAEVARAAVAARTRVAAERVRAEVARAEVVARVVTVRRTRKRAPHHCRAAHSGTAPG